MATRSSAPPIAVILGAHPFPFGNASANRMLTLALTWQAAGFRVVVINDDPRLGAKPASPSMSTVSGIKYLNLGHAHNTRRARLRRRRTFPARTVKTITDAGLSTAAFVVVPSMFLSVSLMRSIRRTLKAASTVVDIVERYDSEQFRLGYLDPQLLRHRYTSWLASRRADLIICISTALARGPLRRRNSLVLPPCVEPDEFSDAAASLRPDNATHIAYIGFPGRKDDLVTILEALADTRDHALDRVRMSFAGFTEQELTTSIGVSAELVDSVRPRVEILGRLDRREVIEALAHAHFTILIRDEDAGYARFGFPSKVPESLAAGCPAIVNYTSDLALYLEHQANAIVSRDASIESVRTAMIEATQAVQRGTYAEMSRLARETAVRRFAPTAWVPALTSWLSFN